MNIQDDHNSIENSNSESVDRILREMPLIIIGAIITAYITFIANSLDGFRQWSHESYILIIVIPIVFLILINTIDSIKPKRLGLINFVIIAITLSNVLLIWRYWDYGVYEKFEINEKRVKVLVIPFLHGERNPSVKQNVAEDLYEALHEFVNYNNLSDYIAIKYNDQAILTRNNIEEDNYIRKTLNENRADILIYGSVDASDTITSYWYSSDAITKDIDSLSRITFASPQKFKSTLRNKEKLIYCPKAVAAYYGLKLSFLTHKYDKVISQYEKIATLNTCSDCSIIKLSSFIVGQSALKLWDERITKKIIKSLESNFYKCKYSNEDVAKKYQIAAWLYYVNEDIDSGLITTRKAIELFKEANISDSGEYLNTLLLEPYGLNEAGKLSEAIHVSQELIPLLNNYPDLLVATYCNIGGYYSKLYKTGGNYYDKAIHFLEKAERLAKNSVEIDTMTLSNIYQNYKYVYFTRYQELQSNGKKYKNDSIKYEYYSSQFGLLNNSIVNIENSTYEYNYSVMQNDAVTYFGKAYDYILSGDSIKYRDSIRINSDKGLTICRKIIHDLSVKQPSSQTLAFTYLVMSSYYTAIKNIDSSIYYSDKSAIIYEKKQTSARKMLPTVYAFLANSYLIKNDLKKSQEYIDKGIALVNLFPEDAELHGIVYDKLTMLNKKIAQKKSEEK